MAQNNKLLRIEELVLYFNTTHGPVQAVDGVNFELTSNRAVVILGESGCGKSSLAKAILRLLPRNAGKYSGRVYLDGKDIMPLSEEEFRQDIRWASISMVPQAAMNALNPVIRVGEQVAEPAIVHLGVDKKEAFSLVRKMFQHVGVPEDFISRYPFELSGGMRQRVAIAHGSRHLSGPDHPRRTHLRPGCSHSGQHLQCVETAQEGIGHQFHPDYA